ncbi:hypothetical protein IV203_008299 [Nitzschia inconspicua]|uniref:Uncharacterized protein n=1 Tax=Nitzschia inconspicua TaxID=303405 RepID=A0A9K3KYX4_9STRA|nr:hypothetical protein IV203_008299 [Nitzschia inconspicua]
MASSDLFEDAPEDDDDVRIVVPTTTTTTTTTTTSVANNHFSSTSRPPPMMTQQDRRRKRRRLFRLLKNPDTVPSFLRVINAPHVINSSSNSSSNNTNDENDTSSSSAKLAVDDDDFLLEPPVVVIDVDEYLGLKKKREEEEQQQQLLQQQPDMTRSGRIIPPPVVSSSSSNNNKNNNNKNNNMYNLLNNPADEGWYEGHLTMAMPEDALYLSELQQWIRRNMEYFSASPEDVHTNQAGRRTPTVRGKVGIRCLHCARAVEARRRQQAETGTATTTKIHFPAGGVSYPMNFAGIYSTSIQKPQLHFEKCPYLPADSGLQALLERSRVGDEERKRMKEGVTALLYWTVSCHRLGMVETNNGVRFGRDLSLEPLPFESTKSKVEQEMPQLARGTHSHNNAFYYSPGRNSAGVTPDRIKSNNNPPPVAPLEPINLPKDAAEVLQEAIDEEDDPNERMGLRSDRHNLSSFMFLTLKQAAICHATAEDFAARGKKTKMMRMGLTGFCCRHCKDNYPTDVKNDGRDGTTAVMQASCRSFSSSSENLASAMSNSFVLHLLKCPYTPQRIQQALETLKKYHTQQMQQLPYGTQSRLFAEIWTRIRAMDKKFHPSEVPQLQSSLNTNQGTQQVDDDDDEEFVPDSAPSFVSTKRGQERPRRGRQPVSDSVPVPGRGPNFPVPNDPETIEILKEVEEIWDPDVNDGLILPEDRNLVSDYLFLCMRQLKVAIPMESDFRGNKRCNLIRLMAGMCCINCAELPDSLFIQPSGRTFPSAPDNMASAFNSSLYNHFLNCPGMPAKLKRVLPIVRKMHSQQCSSLVFGSQRRFFNRVFARLKEVPLHQTLSSSNNTETQYSETSLRDFSFIHRPSKGKDSSGAEEYWQCMNCRMVPFEMRAKGSMFFTEPSTHELRAHFEVCAKDGVSWDRIKLSMQELEDTYGKETKLVDREQFAELVRLTVGNFDGLFNVAMAKLGKDVVTAEPLAGIFWRNLPTNFDFDAIKTAFQSLKVELISSGSNADCTGIMNLLTMLNCNFCPPTTEWEADVNVEKVKTQESVNPTDRIPAKDVEAVEDAVPQPSSDSVDAGIATKSNSDSSNPSATKGASENEEIAVSIPPPASGKEQQEAMEQQFSVPVSSSQFDDLMD